MAIAFFTPGDLVDLRRGRVQHAALCRRSAITSGIGVVLTSPDTRPPMPCTISGSVTTSVPVPSHTSTAASTSFFVIAVQMISDTPKERKSFIFSTRRGVHMPKSLIRNSMFCLMTSRSIFLMPRCLSKIGQ